MSRFQSLLYLLRLNVRYCLPRSAGKVLYSEESESSLSRRESPEAFAARLARYDVISFDVFDTLIFRWFSRPDDVFYLAGLELKYPDFKKIRTEAEAITT